MLLLKRRARHLVEKQFSVGETTGVVARQIPAQAV